MITTNGFKTFLSSKETRKKHFSIVDINLCRVFRAQHWFDTRNPQRVSQRVYKVFYSNQCRVQRARHNKYSRI